jgi:uncharacterized Zn finger protein (UPF0148 family)
LTDQGEVENGTLICVECGRRALAEEEAEDTWRVYADGLGELDVFCPDCEGRESGG